MSADSSDFCLQDLKMAARDNPGDDSGRPQISDTGTDCVP